MSDEIDIEKWLEAPYQNPVEKYKSKERSRRSSKDRHRGRSKELKRKDISQPLPPPPPTTIRRYPSPKRVYRPRSLSRERKNLERDKRTVFVMQLAARLTQSELREFFEPVGRVRAVNIVMDRFSRRSKGVGYVEFSNVKYVEKALQLSGNKLLGIPIIVLPSESEKNQLAMESLNPYFSASRVSENAHHRLYVGGIHFNIEENDLKLIFEPFGKLDFCALQLDDQKRSLGYAFVQYKTAWDARSAMEKLNGFELAGKAIKVGMISDKNTQLPPGVQAPVFDEMNVKRDFSDRTYQERRYPDRDYNRTNYDSTNRNSFSSRQADLVSNNTSFKMDVDDRIKLNPTKRVELMKKLAREPTSSDKKKSEEVKMLTRCLVVKNMFNPSEEEKNGPNWKKEILLDIKMEVDKYGKIRHMDFEQVNSTQADVFIKLKSTRHSEAVMKILNGRWFNKRQLVVAYVPDMVYNSRFPKAADL